MVVSALHGFSFGHGEPVTRLRPGQRVDPYSGETVAPDWTNPDRAEIGCCGFAPAKPEDDHTVAGQVWQRRAKIYAPPGADIAKGDRLETLGHIWDVVGEPQKWVNPFTGWAPGIVVIVERIEAGA